MAGDIESTFATEAAAARGEAEAILAAMRADMERLGIPIPPSAVACLPTGLDCGRTRRKPAAAPDDQPGDKDKPKRLAAA